jgi:hypothetical protein
VAGAGDFYDERMTDQWRDRLTLAADRLESLAARTTPGEWRLSGLLASRPEVVAHGEGGATRHVAEARAETAQWIRALSPSVAPPLVAWLRAAAEAPEPDPAAAELAGILLERLPER